MSSYADLPVDPSGEIRRRFPSTDPAVREWCSDAEWEALRAVDDAMLAEMRADIRRLTAGALNRAERRRLKRAR